MLLIVLNQPAYEALVGIVQLRSDRKSTSNKKSLGQVIVVPEVNLKAQGILMISICQPGRTWMLYLLKTKKVQ
jgi:hypothetical protein